MKKTVFWTILFVFSAFAVFFTSCGKMSLNSVSSTLSASGETGSKPVKGQPADHQALVVLGQEYAERPAVLEPVLTAYGSAEQGGLIRVMRYPESFTVEKRVRLSLLTEAARSSETTLVVTVGAPAGTVNELNKIRATHPDMKIISIMPVEEAFPVEAVSALVLDCTGSADLMAAEQDVMISDQDLAFMILTAVVSAETGALTAADASALAGFGTSMEAARRLAKNRSLGTAWTVASFIDPETNLRSRNHLVVTPGRGPTP